MSSACVNLVAVARDAADRILKILLAIFHHDAGGDGLSKFQHPEYPGKLQLEDTYEDVPGPIL